MNGIYENSENSENIKDNYNELFFNIFENLKKEKGRDEIVQYLANKGYLVLIDVANKSLEISKRSNNLVCFSEDENRLHGINNIGISSVIFNKDEGVFIEDTFSGIRIMEDNDLFMLSNIKILLEKILKQNNVITSSEKVLKYAMIVLEI